ncbi:MAG: GvpL/GvpF family gas vesicle protein [Candidatus Electryoneaceae bacterium]|nr:GvpL/GvpF family gas vesicle protein [Candidatus Electryoneaceae bacterium]
MRQRILIGKLSCFYGRNSNMTNEENTLYLYCLTYSGVPVPEGVGVDGQSAIVVHEFNGIAVLMSVLPQEAFCGADAEARLQDLTWIAPRALRHEQVIEQVMSGAPVLPVQFGTLFRTLDSLQSVVQKNTEAIRQFLDETSEREEWSVKVLMSRKYLNTSFRHILSCR